MKRTRVKAHRRKGTRGVRAHYRTMQPSKYKASKHIKNIIAEPKADGTRAHLYFENGRLKRMINRRKVNFTHRFPELVGVKIRPKKAVLDAEIYVPDWDSPYGDFKKLSMREHLKDETKIRERAKKYPAKILAFDILEKDGKNLTGLPLIQRKRILNEAISDKNTKIKEIEFMTDIAKLEKKMKKIGAEGIVIKDLDSQYEQDRTRYWQKKKLLKTNEVAILGYTKGMGKREGKFGALITGIWTGKNWHYTGNVGTGFNDAEINRLTNKMKKLKSEHKPFYVKGEIVWLKPEIVARVNFQQKTTLGRYRAPSYGGERTDIKPKQTHQI